MNKFFTIILLLLCSFVNAQVNDDRRDYSLFGYSYDRLNHTSKQIASHGNATQITYFDLHFVSMRIQDFMEKELTMVRSGEPTISISGTQKTITTRYIKKANMCISKVKIIQKVNPKIRTFIYHSGTGSTREMKSIALYSPSPLAKRGGVTDLIRRTQYEKYLPKISEQI